MDITRRNQILFAAASFAMFITLSIYVGGVADQLTFSSGSVCLLYVENYHKDAGLNTFIFDSFSPSCGASIAAGSIGFVLLFGFVAIKVWYLRKEEEASRSVIQSLAIVASVWAFVTFVMACVFSAGLAKTCHQFELSGKSCGAVFGEGFFANTTETVFKKNINTINAALGASWVVFLGFASYAGFECGNAACARLSIFRRATSFVSEGHRVDQVYLGGEVVDVGRTCIRVINMNDINKSLTDIYTISQIDDFTTVISMNVSNPTELIQIQE